MAAIFKLTSEKVKDQLAVTLKDASVYDTITAPMFKTALFYSKDDFTTDANLNLQAPGDVYSTGPWTISDLANQSNYQFTGFWAETFRAYTGQVVKEGTIVWWEEQFWVKKSAGSTTSDAINPPDQNSADFALVDVGETIQFATLNNLNVTNATALNIYNLFLGTIGTDGIDPSGQATSTNLMDDPRFTIEKSACHSYVITRQSTGTWEIYVYALPDFVNDGDPTFYANNGSLDHCDVVLPDQDAVYVVKIVFNDTVAQTSSLEYHTIYEYCDLEECFQLVLKDILCNDSVCNPEEDCNNKFPTSPESVKRIDILKICSLYFEMVMLIHAEQMKYLYKYVMTDDRESRLQRASDLMQRINSVLTHCGLCGTGTVGSSGCETCNS